MIKILFLMLMPFIVPLLFIASVVIVTIITIPFYAVVLLFMYDGDWREALDMEHGTNFRKTNI